MKAGPESIRIVADDRENAGGVITALRALPEIAIEVRRLILGDFEVAERFRVERKTLPDFAQSVVDGRLFTQVAALSQGATRAIMILEGTSADLARVGVSRESMQGALVMVAAFYGLPVLRSRAADETARLLLYLARQARRIAVGALPRPGGRPAGRRRRQLFILQGLPGVGPARAARLLERFSTIQAVANAPAEQLATVDGIGVATAQRIRAILH